jgi:hypothetical protein
MHVQTANPFYAARSVRAVTPWRQAPAEPVYVRLPRAPVNTSPVPHLTSLYHSAEAGDYGDRSYPGNCGGNLIRDLLLYFKPERPVLDPMTGSGTCRDVCADLGLDCISSDIHQGFDACGPQGFPGTGQVDFIWAHPPYWRQKIYADDARDLSRTATLGDFLVAYGQFLRNCAAALVPGGKLAVLMGDYYDLQSGYVPLVFHTKRLAFEAGLRQHCTDIVRFSHGASSSKKVYRSSFIPGLHDICSIFEKPA